MSGNRSVERCGALTYDLLTAWLGVYALFLPLFVLVLYVGYRRCTQPSSSINHSDVFTLNLVAMEIMSMAGTCAYCLGYYTKSFVLEQFGDSVLMMAIAGQIVLHDLTCVERYLAVVHPITYLRLKKRGGVKVRNLGVGCAWGHSVLWLVIRRVTGFTVQFCFALIPSILSILVVCFCTASVLCVLIGPRPGEVGGDRKGLDQSKRTAFYTILSILGALMSRFFILLLTYVFYFFPTLETNCFMSVSSFWSSLPSSLVLPLLYLRRAGKLPKWK